ncbi:MAG: AraC family transcriptional regulator ligand-binding domain-containing protein [Sinimarinibacterium sp.]|jgi:AraC-like DNA-binding protein
MSGNLFFALDGPLDSMPARYQMRTANFGHLPELVRHHGSDPRQVLERHGIDPRTIIDPDSYIGCQSLVDVLEDCSARFNDPLFGLHLAELQDPNVYGSVAALCRAAPSFRQAIESFITYIPVIHSPMAQLELAEGKEVVEIRWRVRGDLGANHQAHYQATMLDLKLLRLLGGPAFQPSYVNLSVDARPADVAEVEKQFGCRFRPRAPINAIAFPTEVMNRPVTSANRLVFCLLTRYFDRVKEAARTTVVERVDDYVRGALATGNCSVERCAKKLGTSVRTLQANLDEHGLKFSDILERQRIELARSVLEQGEASLADVAAMLGYSEQSSFGRAFKRWTGLAPQQYRKGARPVIP